MKNLTRLLTLPVVLLLVQCTPGRQKDGSTAISNIQETTCQPIIDTLVAKYGDTERARIEKGVKQAAFLWREADGNPTAFADFCKAHFVAGEEGLKQLFDKLSYGYEMLYGHFMLLNKQLMRPLHLDWGPVTPVDELFGAFSPSAHLNDDLFANKLAFITVLNFPFYSLSEKMENGNKWTQEEWARVRMGDFFTSRIPAGLIQAYATANTRADTYISDYNIYLGYLVDETGNRLFPEDLKLISHWGLRDEIKSQYANGADGLVRQKMIYQVMKRIIDQSIPEQVVNRNEYLWAPYENTLTKDGEPVVAKAEPDLRYQQVVNQFRALKDIDAYTPAMPTFIQRRFEGDYEIPVEEVEALFTGLVASQEVRELGKLISARLGRSLEPFDLWYDGFKARSGIPAGRLDDITTKRFPDAAAFDREIPAILGALGWDKGKSDFYGDRIVVEGSRGAGHAWGAEMKGDVALLRTRIPAGGMNYKGFNIAMHELGHNVEQTITLHDVPYYTLHGVPNTAFTEALAFVFQKRDLEVLGMKETNSSKEALQTLDNLWACYEIMGVSLVDINLWKWLYAHPNATASEVKEAVLTIARDIWNRYYSDVFGKNDETILAVYSHMIDNPLYLSAYPIGHIIDFQIERQLDGKPFANEVERLFAQGRLTPDLWLRKGVGGPLSVKPLLEASSVAITNLQGQ
jgi:hypothetical protein